MYKYKNKTDQEQIVPGVGVAAAGGELVTRVALENPNFDFVGEVEEQASSVVGTEAQQPNAITEASKVAEAPNTEVK